MAGSVVPALLSTVFPFKTVGREGCLAKAQSVTSETVGYAAIGVLSVAMAYTLGAAISRLAEEFFNARRPPPPLCAYGGPDSSQPPSIKAPEMLAGVFQRGGRFVMKGKITQTAQCVARAAFEGC